MLQMRKLKLKKVQRQAQGHKASKCYIWYLKTNLFDSQSHEVYIAYQVEILFSVQLLSPTLCDPMNCSMPGLPVHHQLPEFTQTHVHRVSDAIQPSHPVVRFSSCPQSLPASQSFPMSQLFAWGGPSTGVSALASFLPKKSQGWSRKLSLAHGQETWRKGHQGTSWWKDSKPMI